MKSLRKIITSDLRSLASKLDEIIALCDSKVTKQEGFRYLVSVGGRLNFTKSGSVYYFETIGEFMEALALEDIDDAWYWSLDVEIKELPQDRNYPSIIKMDLRFEPNLDTNGIDLDISQSSFSFARQLMDEILDILSAAYFIKIPEDDEGPKRRDCIRLSISILEGLPNLQARIRKELSSEKDVQDFLYPILKSHFIDLQEEDYLSKVAGNASKPDFGVESLGVAFELKYTSQSATFKKLADEIAIDSRRYFGKGSPFKNLIVLIYNGSSEPIPANYVADLEHIDVISKVIISPKIVPKSK